MWRSTSLVVIGLLAIAGIGMALAGPLDPPSGPVQPTYKTLTEVEPRTAISATSTPGDADCIFRITAPGSYYLTASVTGAAGKSGIIVAASNVTIDLNGFELAGVENSDAGILVASLNTVGLSIRNGIVRGWDQDGIDADRAVSGLLADLNVHSNGNFGANLASRFTVRDCVFRLNHVHGVVTAAGCVVSRCISADNAGAGFVLGADCVVESCMASANGMSGIAAGGGAVITDCVAQGNGAAATGSSDGILVGDGSTVIGCTARNNTSTISGGAGTRGVGIRALNGCVIKDCTSHRNRGHGFRIGSDCRISECTSTENGSGSTISAGIDATGANNHIDANHVNGSDVGIQVVAAGNIITRNTARGNTTAYIIAADNIYGPIIDRRVPTTISSTPAVNGFAASSTMGSSDSRANFAY